MHLASMVLITPACPKYQSRQYPVEAKNKSADAIKLDNFRIDLLNNWRHKNDEEEGKMLQYAF